MIGNPQHLRMPAYSITVPPSASISLVQIVVARVLVVDAQPGAGADDVAAVEGPDLEVGERVCDPRVQPLEPDLLHQQPEEVLVREALLVGEALAGERVVDVRAVVGVGVQPLLALALGALAGGADVHHQLRALHLLGERERAGVQRVGQLLVVLGDHARPRAAGAVELDQLDVQQRCDLGHRAVQLGREAAADTARPVGDLHRFVLPSGLVGAAGLLPPSGSAPAGTGAPAGGSSSS